MHHVIWDDLFRVRLIQLIMTDRHHVIWDDPFRVRLIQLIMTACTHTRVWVKLIVQATNCMGTHLVDKLEAYDDDCLDGVCNGLSIHADGGPLTHIEEA